MFTLVTLYLMKAITFGKKQFFPVLELQEICQYKDHRKKTKPSRFVSSDSKMLKYNSAALTFTVFNSYLHYLHLKGNFYNKPIHLGIMRREKPTVTPTANSHYYHDNRLSISINTSVVCGNSEPIPASHAIRYS